SGAVTAGTKQLVNFSTGNATPPGTYRVGIAATQGGPRHEAFVDLTVRLPIMPALPVSSCLVAKQLLFNENLTTTCETGDEAWVDGEWPPAGTVLAPGSAVQVTIWTRVP